jgi:maltokinase
VIADQIADLLPAYLGRQRWFSGEEPEKVEVAAEAELAHDLYQVLVDVDGDRYHLMVAVRPSTAPLDFLHGHEAALIGAVDDGVAYDALLDGERAMTILERVVPGEKAELVRPMGVEQSNTSLVFDDRVMLKVFRRLRSGPNPDVEVPAALHEAGFENVAEPLGVWREDDTDLAVAQRYLAGGAEGWALAVTSLRDLYASDCEEPAECGGDFGAEARRLGEVTARLHEALGLAFGPERADPAAWAGLVEAQLDRLGPGALDRDAAAAFVGRLRTVADPGVAVRVHGDYHLAQVMRTDAGWFVLDFEGEPARPLEERRRPSSPLKDVAGMLRSFHYAAQAALAEQDENRRDELSARAARWEHRNRECFLGGYLLRAAAGGLIPGDDDSFHTVLSTFELDKALYEALYERAHRPDWAHIPDAAIRRLLDG